MSASARARAAVLFGLQQQLEEARRDAFQARRERDDLARELADEKRRSDGYRRGWNSASNEMRRLQAALSRRKA